MTTANASIIFALLILLLIVTMLLIGNRLKKNKNFSPLAALALAFIVAGLFFGKSPILGIGLFATGIVLAFCDIIVKARNSRRAERSRRQAASRPR
jgi:hypothetical protein